jgi:hypothetical protein
MTGLFQAVLAVVIIIPLTLVLHALAYITMRNSDANFLFIRDIAAEPWIGDQPRC